MKKIFYKLIVLTALSFSVFSFAFAQYTTTPQTCTNQICTGGQYNNQQKYPALCSVLNRTFGYGDSGNDVKQLQIALGQEGIAYIGATGFFGPVTKNAVKVFQLRNGISQTGAVGPITLSRIKTLWCGGQTSNPGGYPPDYNVGTNGPLEVSIAPISSNGYNLTLGWNSKNTNSCSINNEYVPINGQKVYVISNETNFNITCVGWGNQSVTKTITIRPNQTLGSLPSVNVYMNPTSALVNTYATLFWNSSNTDRCDLNGQIVPTSGSQQIYVTGQSQQYKVTCYGSTGLSVSMTVTAIGNGGTGIGNSTATLSANTTSVNSGQPVTLYWSSANNSSCAISGNGTNITGLGGNTSGSNIVYPTVSGQYLLTCTGYNGQVVNSTPVYITVNGSTGGSVSATVLSQTGDYVGMLTTTPNGTQDMHIQLSGLTQQITSVRITGSNAGIWNNPFNGQNWVIQLNQTNSSSIADLYFEPLPNSNNTSYILSITYANGSVVTATATTNTGGTGNVSVSPTSSQVGNAVNIAWNFNNSSTQGVLLDLYDTNNTYIGHITKNITNPQNGTFNWTIPMVVYTYGGDVASCITVSGQQYCGINPKQITAGNYKVRAKFFTPSNACFGFCENVAGQQTLATVDSANFYIGTNSTSNVTANITSNYSTISSGQPVTLTWSSTNANYCNIVANNSSLISNQQPSGTYIVYPSISTNYVLNCYNNNGQNASSFVYVTTNGGTGSLPTANIYASSQSVTSGQSVTINWYSANANTCNLSANGNVIQSNQNVSGSYLVYPTTSTNYQVTCTNNSTNQSATANVYVAVNGTGGGNTSINLVSKSNTLVRLSITKSPGNSCTSGYLDFGNNSNYVNYSYPPVQNGSACVVEVSYVYVTTGSYNVRAIENGVVVATYYLTLP